MHDKFSSNTDGYIPGKCNLGRKEVNRRKLQTLIGFGITLFFILILQKYHFPREWRLFVFFPLSYSVLCFQQARQKFCVLFGIKGVYNFSDVRKVVAVKEEEYLLKDRKKAWRIIFSSLLIGIVVVVVYFYLPL